MKALYYPVEIIVNIMIGQVNSLAGANVFCIRESLEANLC